MENPGIQQYLSNRVIGAIVFCLLFVSCAHQRGLPRAGKETVKGVLLYEFKKNGDYFCEVSGHIVLDGKQAFFYDVRGFNSSVLREYKELQKEVGADTLYSHFVNDPDSLVNLRFSSFLNNPNNINGVSSFSSPSFYNKAGNASIFIAFNFEGEVIHYNSTKLTIRDESGHATECCPGYNTNVGAEFYILSRGIKNEALTPSQEVSMGLIKSSIEQIEIFYCE